MRPDALEGTMPPHDNAYKNLFTHPQVVQDLLRGFVHEDWVQEIDFSTLEKASGSYVSDDLRDSEFYWAFTWLWPPEPELGRWCRTACRQHHLFTIGIRCANFRP